MAPSVNQIITSQFLPSPLGAFDNCLAAFSSPASQLVPPPPSNSGIFVLTQVVAVEIFEEFASAHSRTGG